MWQYYFEKYEEAMKVPDAMYPFLADVKLALAGDGLVTLPANFGHPLLVSYIKYTTVPGSNPLSEEIGANYLSKDEEGNTLESAVRGPSLSKRRIYWGYATAGKMKMYPTGIAGQFRLQYLRYPTFAVRGVTIDSVNDEENYNAGTSTQYEWPLQQENDLIDLLLMQKGLETRDSEIVRWASQRQSVTPNVMQ